MNEIFFEYGIDLDEKSIKSFGIYYRLLKEYNEKFNITAIEDEREIYLKHFVDSLSGAELLTGGKLIDIGSGGGFPAVPIKIVNDSVDLTLVEATGKKCEFLKVLCENLGLKDVKIVNKRAEDIAHDINFREKFDYCTARAVAKLNILSEYCLPFLKTGGKFIAYKADAGDELKEAANALRVLGGKTEKIKKFSLDGAERQLIVIEKIKRTEEKYPRSNGRIRKNPL